MIEHPVARHPAIPMAVRPGESGAGGGERLEAEALQKARASHVPGIGKDEASCLVQLVKCAALVGDTGADVGHASTPQRGVRLILIPIVHAAENSRTSRRELPRLRWFPTAPCPQE